MMEPTRGPRGERRPARRRRRAARRRRERRRRRSALAALTSGALALPGLARDASGETPGGRISAQYAFSFYAEDRLPSSKVTPGGERSRFEIAINQFHLAGPLGDRLSLELDLGHEAMSGASPWYVVPDPNGQPVQVMTGATIREARTDARVQGSYEFDSGRASLAGGISSENDYLAFSGNFQGERSFFEKNTTLTSGAGFSIDEITPTDAAAFGRVPRAHRQSYTALLGISQVIGDRTQAQTSLQYQHARGFLSDPYKQVLVAGTPIRDARPDRRNQLSWLTRLRHHVPELGGTLHADYLFYLDDWEVTSHTLELAWHQTVWQTLQLVPSLRYYSQSQAAFYAPFFVQARADGLGSSDYRLSPYGALSWRLKAETSFDLWKIAWRASFSWQRYLSGADLALAKVSVENPGLVSYNLFTVGLTGAF